MPSPSTDQLSIDIVNEEIDEDQYINEVKLLEVIHNKNVSIIPDQDGNVHTISAPIHAKNGREELTAKGDGLSFDFSEQPNKDGLYELDLEFDRSDLTDKAKLILNVKNTSWSGYVLQEWYGLFGSGLEANQERMAKRSAEELNEWRKDQGISMSVFVKTGEKWVFQQDINVVGNKVSRDIVVPIDLTAVEGDITQIKLVAGFKLWEIDFAQLDYSDNEAVSIRELETTLTQNDDDKDIASDDKLYRHLQYGDTLSLNYELRSPNSNQSASYVLKTKGYYDKHFNQDGSMAVREVMSFKKKGQMSLYSRYLMENMFSEIEAID